MRTQRKPAAASIAISPGRGSVKWILTPSPSVALSATRGGPFQGGDKGKPVWPVSESRQRLSRTSKDGRQQGLRLFVERPVRRVGGWGMRKENQKPIARHLQECGSWTRARTKCPLSGGKEDGISSFCGRQKGQETGQRETSHP